MNLHRFTHFPLLKILSAKLSCFLLNDCFPPKPTTMAETSTPVTRPPLQSPALYSIPSKTSLYVGDLHPQVTEVDLIQTFGKIGQLFSVRVCRARDSFKSLCYGYVNFWNPSHASKALASLNHTELKGEPMRIMWCERDPIGRKNGIANLYVKNLVPSITSSRLEEMFGKYGTILSCKVAENNGKSQGFGFVQFESEDSAKAAVSALHGTMLEGKKLYVCKFVRRSERNTTSTELFTNLFVKNLDKGISEDILREKFSEYGKVSNVVIMKDDGGISKGFGFVQFISNEEAIEATECMNGALLGSKRLFVARAQKKEEGPEILKTANKIAVSYNSEKLKASKLYVKNLNDTVDNRKLEELFCPFGKVTYAKVMRDHYGFSKGSGVVCFSTPQEAKKALDSLNGSIVEGMHLFLALAQTEEKGYIHPPTCSLSHKQPFYSTNWNAFVPQYEPIYYTSPYNPSPVSAQHFISTVKPRVNQNFSKSAGGYRELKNHPDKFCSWTITSAYGSSHDQTTGAWKQQQSSNKLGNRNTHVPVEKSSTKAVSVSCDVTASSEEERKERMTNLLRLYIKGMQLPAGKGCKQNPYSDSLAAYAGKGKQVDYRDSCCH